MYTIYAKEFNNSFNKLKHLQIIGMNELMTNVEHEEYFLFMTFSRYLCIDFAEIFFTSASHGICFTVFIWEQNCCHLFPLPQPQEDQNKTRKSIEIAAEASVGEVLPYLNVWTYFSLLLLEH